MVAHAWSGVDVRDERLMVSENQVETQAGIWSCDGGLVLDEPKAWCYGRKPVFDGVRAGVSDVGVKGVINPLYTRTVKISSEQYMGFFLLAEYVAKTVVEFVQIFSKISWGR